MSGASLQEQLAAMRELLERERTAHIETKASLKNALAGRSPFPPASPSAVLEQLFSPSTRDSHSTAPAAQSTLSHAIARIRDINAMTQRLCTVDARTKDECIVCKAAVVAVRRTMHAAVDAKCDEIKLSLEKSKDQLLLKTKPSAAKTNELLVAMNTCQRVASEALQSGEYESFEAESEACAAALAKADGSLPHLDVATTSLEEGIGLGFHATWEESQKTALDALRSMGGVKTRGICGPLWRFFTEGQRKTKQIIFRFCAPADADDHKGRVQWASALAVFDCALRNHTVLCKPISGMLWRVLCNHGRNWLALPGTPPEVCEPTAIGAEHSLCMKETLSLTEVAAREWCAGAIAARAELVEQFQESVQATADSGGKGPWKALVATPRPQQVDSLFTKYHTSYFAMSEDGKRVTKQNSNAWCPAIADKVLEPNSGVYAWGVEVMVAPNSNYMFGVCPENTNHGSQNVYGGAVVITAGGGNGGGNLGTHVGGNSWHDGGSAAVGDRITMILDTDAGTLTFAKNGRLALGSFGNLQGKRVRPYVDVHHAGVSLRFVKPQPVH